MFLLNNEINLMQSAARSKQHAPDCLDLSFVYFINVTETINYLLSEDNTTLLYIIDFSDKEKALMLLSRIKLKHINPYIIYANSSIDNMIDIMPHKPIGYLDDVYDAKNLLATVNHVISKISAHALPNIIKSNPLISPDDIILQIEYKNKRAEISYFSKRDVENSGDKLKATMRKVSRKMSLSKAKERFPYDYLINCSQSTIVNVNYIEKIDNTKNMVILTTGSEINVSCRHKSAVKHAFENKK